MRLLGYFILLVYILTGCIMSNVDTYRYKIDINGSSASYMYLKYREEGQTFKEERLQHLTYWKQGPYQTNYPFLSYSILLNYEAEIKIWIYKNDGIYKRRIYYGKSISGTLNSGSDYTN